MKLLTAGEGEEEAEEDGEPAVLQFVQLVLRVQHLLLRPEVCVFTIAVTSSSLICTDTAIQQEILVMRTVGYCAPLKAK